MTTFMWLAVVVGGPVLIGLVLAYVMINRRKLSPRENAARKQAIRDMYEKPRD
jgi:hypothetical protein